MDETKRLARNVKRFWSMVDKKGSNDCWRWLRGKDSYGYGVFYANGRNNQAHRFSMEMHLGQKLRASKQLRPGDQLVLHNCDNPACVNPKHLYVGRQSDNIKDRDNRSRTSVGESRPASKLNAFKVGKIRRLRRKGWTITRLAKRFKLHTSTVYGIIKRKAWKHVS